MLFESPEELNQIVSKAGFANSGGATVVRKEGRGCAIIKCMKTPIPEKGTPGMLSELFNDTYKTSSGAVGEARLTIQEALSVSATPTPSGISETMEEKAEAVSDVKEVVKEKVDMVADKIEAVMGEMGEAAEKVADIITENPPASDE